MKSQISNNPSGQLENLLQEANLENSINGLEFIADELLDKTNARVPQANEKSTLDWFGLSDLCI